MKQTVTRQLSPYRVFTSDEWATLRADTPLTLTKPDLEKIKSLNDPISLREVEEIYLPLSRLLSYYVEFAKGLNNATQHFLGTNEPKTPFIIGIAGSVSVGKSTTARLLQTLLSRWPASPKVDLVTTDGFLLPNAVLEAEGLMRRKGFPESYDRTALIEFLTDIKAGKRNVRAPVYSHFYYDVMSTEAQIIDQPDILILEGLNVLQTSILPTDAKDIPFVSDFFDFSVYIDADEDMLHQWYLERFSRLRETAFRDPGSYFHRYSLIDEAEALTIANDLWSSINLVNLRENIFPTRPRADLVLRKEDGHAITTVMLRKL
ncbi:type I pantothenate kinase [uncultured Cohaesibacter sp.]|uniref:type I pantothenate kinase n=1 Tax=uncultured Cohaesibacter sp. TaxID=1002546 RepID=UPI0029C9885C|nr:type I pantothenate kinase [uncultured Cohaesibacter sp.]